MQRESLHKRVATRQNGYRSSPIILREQFVDSSGEVAGPLLTKTDYLEAKDKGKEVELKKRLKAIDDAALQDGFPSASIITYHKEALEMIEKRKRAAQNQTKKSVDVFRALIFCIVVSESEDMDGSVMPSGR